MCAIKEQPELSGWFCDNSGRFMIYRNVTGCSVFHIIPFDLNIRTDYYFWNRYRENIAYDKRGQEQKISIRIHNRSHFHCRIHHSSKGGSGWSRCSRSHCFRHRSHSHFQNHFRSMSRGEAGWWCRSSCCLHQNQTFRFFHNRTVLLINHSW